MAPGVQLWCYESWEVKLVDSWVMNHYLNYFKNIFCGPWKSALSAFSFEVSRWCNDSNALIESKNPMKFILQQLHALEAGDNWDHVNPLTSLEKIPYKIQNNADSSEKQCTPNEYLIVENPVESVGCRGLVVTFWHDDLLHSQMTPTEFDLLTQRKAKSIFHLQTEV